MDPIDTFHTDRLVAHRLRADDFDDLYQLHRDARVMATLAPAGHPAGGVLSAEETRQFLRRNLEHWDRYGYGLWLFRDRADRRFIGRGNLRNLRIGGGDEIEVGYALGAEYWGQGLATEMARALVAAGFGRLGLAELVCFTLTTNLASRRVMEKAGFRYERDIVHAGLPHRFYRLTAAQWREG
jgi:RimJ/RimL family protein N-acetyltransferase